MSHEWTETNYLEGYAQILEVNEDVASRNQDGLMLWRKLGCRDWLTAAQDRSSWQHLLEEAKAHLEL
jgi:hypothetical protein